MADPSFLELFRSGELQKRIELGNEILRSCDLCPRECRIDRTRGEIGFCMIGNDPVISSYGPHIGEEPPLVGINGSGTVFFSGCNMGCRYCQNHGISQEVSGRKVDPEGLADIFMKVQGMGCHNLNLVSPSHVVPQILEALEKACRKGFSLPIVYNTGGYDSLRTLELLDGIVDIYMPDMKYNDPAVGERLSHVRNYPDINFEAVREMHRQVGDLVIDENGLAVSGLIVRHLILPNDLAGTRSIMEFLSNEISKDTYVNIMDQYRPEYRAMECSGMGRMISRYEYAEAVKIAEGSGLHRFAERS